MRLRYVIGSIENFDAINAQITAMNEADPEGPQTPLIDYSNARKSVDGTQTFIHQENLDDTQMGLILHSFAADSTAWNLMSNDNDAFKELLASEAWTLLEAGEGV